MDYLEQLEKYKSEMIEKIGESVAFPSVVSDAVKTVEGEILPFGRDVHNAFSHALKLGEDLGFEVYNADNYGGHIEFSSEEPNAETIGISGHLDVVPVTDGWETDPFKMVEKDGYIYGRGVLDDKGPLMAALYAMKALKDVGFKPKKNIRLILGLDEETKKEGMLYYLDAVGQPDMGFTPDSGFPLVNGEMGFLVFDLAQKLTKQTNKEGLRLTKFEAGTVPNAVPAIAKAVISASDEMYELIKGRMQEYILETDYELRAKKQGKSLVIEAIGKAAHGAHPDMGLNPISIMMDFLGKLQFSNEEVNDYIAFYNEYIGFNLHGEKIGCELEDDKSGKLVFNVGMISINEDIASMKINIRYPVTCTSEEVYAGIEQYLEKTNIGLVKESEDEPIFLDIDDPLVEKLMDAYRDETGDAESKPYVIAGGSYAKCINKTLAFGTLFPGEEDTMHQSNERKSIDLLWKAARIYARAIYNICC